MTTLKHVWVRDETGEDWFTGKVKLYRHNGKESSGVSMFFLKGYLLYVFYKIKEAL